MTCDARSNPAVHSKRRLDLLNQPDVRYPAAYTWLILFSSLDIMLTWVILALGGREVNPIAAEVIELWGLAGAILFKFSLMLFVIVICEIVGRRNDQTARYLVYVCVAISALPVLYSIALLWVHVAVEVAAI